MSDSAPRFHQGRKDAATNVDILVDRCLADHYDVDVADVYSIESLTDSEHVVENGYEIHQILDYGGCDAVVDCGDRHVHVAKRVRPNNRRDPELSLRVETGVPGRFPELTKWRRAYETHGYYPDIVAYGVYDYVIDALQVLHLIDTAGLLGGLSEGTLAGERHPTGDGTAALYVDPAELDAAGHVRATFEGVIGHD